MTRLPIRVAAPAVVLPGPPDLPRLEPMPAVAVSDLTPGASLDLVRIVDLDVAGCSLRGARLTEVGWERVSADGLDLREARLVSNRVADLRSTQCTAAGGQWREVEVHDSRIGAWDVSGSHWRRVALAEVRLGFVNLRHADLADVTFTGVTADEVDLSHAHLRRVVFRGCVIGQLTVGGAQLIDVDLRGARLGAVSGAGGLAGAVLSGEQVLGVAEDLARHLGITIA